jgi:hypothetical protein
VSAARIAPAVVLTAGLAACGRPAAPVATLTEATGVVEASRGADGAWQGAAPVTQLAIDDGVQTGPRSSARLSIVAGGGVRLSENSRLRFRRGGAADTGGVELGIDLGRAELEASEGLSLITAAGGARIERGSRVRITADDPGRALTTLEVIVGRAVLTPFARADASGTPVAVGAGQGVTLHIGTAVVEYFSVQVGEAVLEPDGQTERSRRDAGTASGQREARTGEGDSAPAARFEPASPAGAAPANAHGAHTEGADARRAEVSDARHADVTVTAGESLVLHDGKPPLLVRVRFGALCPDGGVVDLGPSAGSRHRLSGANAVVARLAPGVHAYRVFCASDHDDHSPRATGVLTVKRDSGNVPLARRAPTNVIEADGRRYTVLYQTRLPALTLSWAARAGAHTQGQLEIHVQSPSGARVFRSQETSLRLPPGALGEGEHTWWFVAGDGRESPRTAVAIRFDNTAPTAQFFPAAGAPAPQGTVAIDGVTVKGAKVSIAGKELAVDDHGRFQDAVAPAAGDDAVAVRIETPHGEAHCYVKRQAQAR